MAGLLKSRKYCVIAELAVFLTFSSHPMRKASTDLISTNKTRCLSWNKQQNILFVCPFVFSLSLTWNLPEPNDNEASCAVGVALHSMVARYRRIVQTGCFLLQSEKSSSLYKESADFSGGNLASCQSRRLHIPDENNLLFFSECHNCAMIFVRQSHRIFDESSVHSNVFFAQRYFKQTLSYYHAHNHY